MLPTDLSHIHDWSQNWDFALLALQVAPVSYYAFFFGTRRLWYGLSAWGEIMTSLLPVATHMQKQAYEMQSMW